MNLSRRMDLSVEDTRALLMLVRDCIQQALTRESQPPWSERVLPAVLKLPGASMVTIRLGRDLRGSAGGPDVRGPLCQDVWHNAWAAAFADSRFAPLSRAEWPAVNVHVSVFTKPERLTVWSEAGLIKKLRRSDGLILEYQGTRAIFPPSAWSNIAEPADFVAFLKIKAGCPHDHWASDIKVERFSAIEVGEVER